MLLRVQLLLQTFQVEEMIGASVHQDDIVGAYLSLFLLTLNFRNTLRVQVIDVFEKVTQANRADHLLASLSSLEKLNLFLNLISQLSDCNAFEVGQLFELDSLS